MSTHIYWFSGTGNSFRVARAIGDGLTDSELFPIARAVSEPAPMADSLGLVFPVYAWGPPAIVTRFIENLPRPVNAYVFCVLTYGGSPGSTAAITRELLRKRGIDLSAVFGVRMPENYPPLGGAPKPEKRERIIAEAEETIEVVVNSLKASPHGHFDKNNVFWNVLGRLVNPMFRKSLRKSDRKFTADEKCNHCGLCARVCPVTNIEMVEDAPRWLGHCEQCFACFHWCPQKAIQYGRKTEQQIRYHHPACRISDLITRDRNTEDDANGAEDGSS